MFSYQALTIASVPYICFMRIPGLILLCSIFFCAHTSIAPFKRIVITGFAQGTSYHITYYAGDSSVTQFQIDSIFNKLDSSLSIYKPYSLISRFNNANTTTVEMDEHFSAVINTSIDTWRATSGLFDITVQPLVQAWGFGIKKTDSLPGKKEVNTIRKCVGSQFLKVENNKLVKLKPCMTIDVNGIAQGYSVDVMAAFLEANGINNYLVEIGGELRVKGRKQPSNEKMKIGIESPGEDELAISMRQQVIETDSGAITTSGNYRKYYESNGKKITHLINPRTGYPIQNELISVTVFAADAITADAFDNALMVLGLTKALRFTEKRKDICAYFIYRDKKGVLKDTASTGFYRLMQ